MAMRRGNWCYLPLCTRPRSLPPLRQASLLSTFAAALTPLPHPGPGLSVTGCSSDDREWKLTVRSNDSWDSYSYQARARHAPLSSPPFLRREQRF